MSYSLTVVCVAAITGVWVLVTAMKARTPWIWYLRYVCLCGVSAMFTNFAFHVWLQKHDGDNVKHENEKLIRSLCDAVDGVVMPVTDGLTALAELRSRAGSYCDHSARYRTRLLYTPTTARSVDLTAVV